MIMVEAADEMRNEGGEPERIRRAEETRRVGADPAGQPSADPARPDSRNADPLTSVVLGEVKKMLEVPDEEIDRLRSRERISDEALADAILRELYDDGRDERGR